MTEPGHQGSHKIGVIGADLLYQCFFIFIKGRYQVTMRKNAHLPGPGLICQFIISEVLPLPEEIFIKDLVDLKIQLSGSLL